jgi:outer membrane protein
MSTAGILRGTSLALLVAVSCAMPGLVAAETLQEAWQLAIERDNVLAAARSDVEGARAGEQAARGARWPSLEASAGYTRLNASPELSVTTPGFDFRSGSIFRDNEFVSGNMQMKLPLYAGGQISAGIDAAHHSYLGASEAQQVTTSALKLDVAEAYIAVLRARRTLRAAESSVASLTAHVHDVQYRVERESVARSDLLAAQVALANAEQIRVRTANEVEITQGVYNRRLGEPLERAPELDERVPVDLSLAAQTVESLIKQAVESRSELKAMAAHADSLNFQARAESGKRLPQLALTGGYTHIDNQILDRQNVAMIGLGVTWNLFDGGQTRNRASALRSAGHAAESRLQDLRTRIQLEVRERWLDVQEAQARVKASREAVAQAEENLRSTRELYGAGLGTNTQVLDAVTLQIAAVNNQDNAILDASLSGLRLAYAVGVL